MSEVVDAILTVLFVYVQMDDEASLLPRKLQAALEQTLEQRNDIINQDSDSESDEGESADITLVFITFINNHSEQNTSEH